MKRHIGFLSVLLVGSGALVSCQDDTEHFDNKIYNTAEQTSTVFVEEEADSYVRTLQAQLAMPADSDISFAYVADPGQVEWYNTAYSDSAGMLPADYYEIPDPEAVIPAGETASSEVEIRFRNLLSLDKTQVYVLPVSIDGADVATLASRRTVYFVVKEASLVNVVANLRENAVSVEWRNPDPLRNLRSLTAEALVKVDEFADGRGRRRPFPAAVRRYGSEQSVAGRGTACGNDRRRKTDLLGLDGEDRTLDAYCRYLR